MRIVDKGVGKGTSLIKRNVVLLGALYFSCLVLFSACNKQTEKTSSGVPTTKTFIILGSSTAFGVGATVVDSSWVRLLAAKFKSDAKQIEVVNLAQNAFTTYHILPTNTVSPIQKPVPDTVRNITKALTLHPDLIIINLPSNDIWNGFSDNEILENYKKITTLITEKKISFILTSTQPRNLPDFSNRKRLKEFNTKLLTNYPFNVDDYYNLLSDDNLNIRQSLDSGDGIHLNNKGHRIVFEHIFSNPQVASIAGY